MKYSVVLYPSLIVRIRAIEANSYEEAIHKSIDILDSYMYEFTREFPGDHPVDYVALDSDVIEEVLVDPVDKTGIIYHKSRWYKYDFKNGEYLIDVSMHPNTKEETNGKTNVNANASNV